MSSTSLDALLAFPLLEGVTQREIALLNLRPVRRTIKAGEIIIDREDKSRDVYFLETGRVLAVYWTADGREIIFGRIANGAYFGEMAALDNAERSLSVYVHRDVQALVLSQTDFLKLIDEIPAIRARVFADLVRRIRDMIERNYQTSSLNVEMRVRAYLVRLGLEAGELISGGEIREAPTHLEIANSVGSNREAVSRVMGDLRRSGIIECGRQRINFRDPGKLVEQVV